MAIRITGMYSGLDTESIITQLASAQSTKKNNLVRAQTKLSWKQDAWKALNTKIYSFYTNVLDNMRFQSSYMKKTTKVSNSNAVSVVTGSGAPNSVQSLKIGQLAKEAYLTSGTVSTGDGGKVSKSTKLSELGITEEGNFAVNVGGKTTNITLNGDMKISDVVKQFESAGLNASFDEKNQRFYLTAKGSGAAADFTITSNDANGKDILSALGLGSTYNKDSSEYKEYALWASYAEDTGADACAKAKEAEALKRAQAKKANTDALTKKNEELQKKLETLQKTNDESDRYALDYDENDATKVNKQKDDLYNELYGKLTDVPKKDENGEPVLDEVNNPVMVQERQGGLQQKLDGAKEALKTAQDALAELRKNDPDNQEDIKAKEKEVAEKSSDVSKAQADFNEKAGEYSFVAAVADVQNSIEANNAAIAENKTYYNVTEGEDGKETVTATEKMEGEVTDYFDSKIAAAQAYMADANLIDDYENYEKKMSDESLSEDDKKELKEKYEPLKDAYEALKALTSNAATKIDGQDAQITLNGVSYSNSNNTFEINGLTITAQQETDEEITLTTSEDTDGIYDMIKNFFTEYNKLINEMSALYNADSSKGYDPLLSEEKAEMADSEIEEWEKKIKESLLRRDSTLGDVSDAMKTVMLQGATVNGQTMYLSQFGINTLGYFNAADNEKSAYHINDDKDDVTVSKEEDTLRAMIASDPDTVMNFFSKLANNLYDKLSDKMKAVKDTSSAFTVYNDKTLKKEYDDYKDKITKEETKLNALMDKWYSKFSSMETALAKLQSKNSAVASMFGGN